MLLEPIITSLLETDMYKFSMGQCIYHQFSDYKTTWSFKCRNTDVHFTHEMVEEIKEQIAYTKGGKACPKCGAVVSGSAAFCSKCGAKMDEDIFEDEDEVVTEEKTDEAAEETVETVSGEVVEEDEE